MTPGSNPGGASKKKHQPVSWCFFLQTPIATIENPRGKAHPLSGTPHARREHSQRAGPPGPIGPGGPALCECSRRAWGVPERGWAFPLGFSIVAIGVCKKKHQLTGWCFFLEAPPGFEPGVKDLQSHALPLGYGAKKLERATRFELATSTLARWRSAK